MAFSYLISLRMSKLVKKSGKRSCEPRFPFTSVLATFLWLISAGTRNQIKFHQIFFPHSNLYLESRST